MFARLPSSRSRSLLFALALMLTFSAGTAWTAFGDDGGTTIYACLTTGGTLNSVSVDTPPDCQGQNTLISWNQEGPEGQPGGDGAPGQPGEDGEFSGVFTSPNGDYSISVTDDGIELSGPGSTISLIGGNVVVSGTNVTLDSTAFTRVNGAIVQLNCPGGGGLPVARATDPVLVDTGSGAGAILFGSPTVGAC